MKVKRLIASFGASFDSFVGKMENHEAVADCAIADVRGAAAKLRVQKGRIQYQIQRLQEQQNKLHTEQKLWQSRALKLGDSDEQRSLLCIKQLKITKDRHHQVKQQITEYQAMDNQLQHNLTDVERRLEQLQLKKTNLSSRSARASALHATQNCGELTELEQVFDRWEVAVLEDEYLDGVISETTDSFEREFLAEEELNDLRAQLRDLQQANTTVSMPIKECKDGN